MSLCQWSRKNWSPGWVIMKLEDLKHSALLKISESIDNDSLVLPRVPEVVEKIDAAMVNQKTSIKEISEIIKFEASISARILQIANSPLIRGNAKITSLHSAVTRIGLEMVRNLVLCMAVKDSLTVRQSYLKKRMRQVWGDCIAVSMYSYVLANHFDLDADFAMMAGMLHNLGVLPIVGYVGKHDDLVDDSGVLDYLVSALHKPLGVRILKQWEMQRELIEVTEGYDEIDKARPGAIDIVDIVMVANCYNQDVRENTVDWYRVRALRKMHLSSSELDLILEDAVKEVSMMSEILFR
jgi:HD-like signal output (HDOD) protein